MIAYVLSGGNLRGALQVGALQALIHDPARRPELIVGTSIGAINGALLAADPTPQGVERLADIWRSVERGDVYRGNRLMTAWRLIRRKDSLFPGEPLWIMLRRAIPPDINTFGDLKISFYLTGCTLNSTALYVWGDDRTAALIDALVTSAALPGVFPPVNHGGHQYVDGGVIANMALEVAVDRGATEIYALDVGHLGEQMPSISGFVPIVQRTIQIMLHQQTTLELERVVNMPGITLHHVRLSGYKNLAQDDFSQIDRMIADGRRQAEKYLSRPTPNIFQADLAPPPPPGAIQFVRNHQVTQKRDG